MVLFEPEQYKQLEEVAKKTACISIGQIIRKAVDEMVPKRSTEDKRLEAAKRLTTAEEDFVE